MKILGEEVRIIVTDPCDGCGKEAYVAEVAPGRPLRESVTLCWQCLTDLALEVANVMTRDGIPVGRPSLADQGIAQRAQFWPPLEAGKVVPVSIEVDDLRGGINKVYGP